MDDRKGLLCIHGSYTLSLPRLPSDYQDNIGEQGAELSDSTYKTTDIFRIWSPGDSYVVTENLYSCIFDSAPERIDDAGILSTCICLEVMLTDSFVGMVHIGTISVDFTNVDMNRFKQRTGTKGLEYKLDYQLGVDFRSDEGFLRCFCLADGKTIGVTTITFTDLAGY